MTDPSKPEQLKKIQFYMTEQEIEELDRMRQGKVTRTMFFKLALSLLKVCLDQKNIGRRFGSLDDKNNFHEVLIPGFD